jgi:hypothetical protein
MVGFGNGGFVGLGDGGGGGSSSTERVGDGEGFRVFEFSLVLTFALRFTPGISLTDALGSGEADVFALELIAGLVELPAATPASASPVGGLAGSTGLLLGSAVNADPGAVAFVGWELRVKA